MRPSQTLNEIWQRAARPGVAGRRARPWRSRLRALAATTAVLAAGAAAAGDLVTPGPYTALAVFGDSLSDSGNNALVLGTGGPIPTSNTFTPALAPYASGTYSNGPVWVNGFAAGLGLAGFAAPSLGGNGGADYASGGARTNNGGVFPASGVNQVNSFLAGVSSLPASGLYVIAIGGNDVRDVGLQLAGGASPTIVGPAAAAYAAAVGSMVDALQAKGAQHIIVWDTPDVGTTPAALATPGASTVGTMIASSFNQALAARLTGEAGVSVFDVFGFVDGIVANPAAYGLSNVTDACGALVNACSASLATSLFYDGIHPTAAGHAILAQAMTNFALAAAVPEPGSWLLMALGLGVVLMRRRP